MSKQDLEKSNGKTFRIILSVVFALIVILVAVYAVLNLFFSAPVYYNVSSEEAFDLINNSADLTVLDVRGLEGCSICQFNKGHLPGAEMSSNPKSYYNWTSDILVYSKNGTVGAAFSDELKDHVYGKVYNLEGGYEAWEAKGYPNTDDYIYTSSFSTVSPSKAYDMINTSSEIRVVDCRGLEGCSHCQFNKGHLPGAELISNSLLLYNSTEDILVYSKDGTVGEDFCQDITGHVYGEIYNIDGGYNAWVAAGFPV